MNVVDLRAIGGFTFPDGQPHLEIPRIDQITPQERDGGTQVICRISSSDDLMYLLLAKDVLDRRGFRNVRLKITYLLGARMDRPIDGEQPFTLKVIADVIKNAGFYRISVFDPHSDVATGLLDAFGIMPTKYVSLALSRANAFAPPIAVMIPDAGAVKRTGDILGSIQYSGAVVQAMKHRDMQTGKLSGFQILNPDECDGRHVLIVDDLCDGGGTFLGLAEEARKAGAEMVSLYVSHGVFSKGLDALLDNGIDNIYTTDSYGKFEAGVYADKRVIVDAL